MFQQFLSVLFALLGVLGCYWLIVRLIDGPIQITGHWLGRALTLFRLPISPRVSLVLGMLFWLGLGLSWMRWHPQ